jgi:hypothetical protein
VIACSADMLAARDKARYVADIEDAEDIDREFEFPAITDYQDAVDNPKEPAVPLDEPVRPGAYSHACSRIVVELCFTLSTVRCSFIDLCVRISVTAFLSPDPLIILTSFCHSSYHNCTLFEDIEWVCQQYVIS